MIDLWFATPVYYTYLDKFLYNNKDYIDFTNKIKEETPEVETNWRCPTYATLYVTDLREEELFKPLIQACKDHISLFASELSIVHEGIECIDAWVNVAEHKDFQEAHIHPNSHFSAVYYIKTPANCGRIVFKAPDDMYPVTVHTHTMLSAKTCHYEAEENKLIIFRSNVPHMVEANLSDESRMSIAMNFRLTGPNYD